MGGVADSPGAAGMGGLAAGAIVASVRAGVGVTAGVTIIAGAGWAGAGICAGATGGSSGAACNCAAGCDSNTGAARPGRALFALLMRGAVLAGFLALAVVALPRFALAFVVLAPCGKNWQAVSSNASKTGNIIVARQWRGGRGADGFKPECMAPRFSSFIAN